MKKTIMTTLAAVALFGAVACEDRRNEREVREVEVKTDNDRRLGDARPDDGHEGYFENDGVNDNLEGKGGSGKVEIDAKVDHDRNKTDVDVEADKDDGKLKIDLK